MLRNCIFGLLFAASLSSHAAVRTVIVQPGEITPTYGPGVGGDAFIDGRDWNATVSDQKGSRHTVPVTLEKKYSWPTFRGALKNALKVNPGQLALTGVVAGALAGVDWIMSPDNTQIQKKQDVPLPYTPASGQYAWALSNPNGTPAAGFSSPTAACAVLNSMDPSRSHVPIPTADPLRFNCSNSTWWTTRYGSACPSGSTYNPQQGTCTTPQLLPVSDADLDSFVGSISDPSFAASAAPDILSSVPGSFDYPDSETFGGPNSIELPSVETTSLDQVSGDTVVKQETTTLDLVYSKNPLSVTATPTTVTNTYQNGTLINTTTNTVTGPTVDAQPLPEVPTDCEFMPTVCEWLAWFKEPMPMPEVDLPTPEDQDFEETYSANFGGGCPPPRQIALTLFPPVQFSWEPLCDFAGYLKFLVVGGAALMAAFIGLGISRGNA